MEMPDREKVIKALDYCTHSDDCLGCIHWQKVAKGEKCTVRDDALALLKEQEDLGTELMNAVELIHKKNERIEKLLKEQAWHLLTEDDDGIIHGLPGDDGQYLMTDGEDIWIDDYVDGVEDGVWFDSGRDIREVKAWMYMPELPKQEGR